MTRYPISLNCNLFTVTFDLRIGDLMCLTYISAKRSFLYSVSHGVQRLLFYTHTPPILSQLVYKNGTGVCFIQGPILSTSSNVFFFHRSRK